MHERPVHRRTAVPAAGTFELGAAAARPGRTGRTPQPHPAAARSGPGSQPRLRRGNHTEHCLWAAAGPRLPLPL